MYRKTMTAALAATLVFSTGGFSPVLAGEPNEQADHAFDNKIIKKISADNMYETIRLLSQESRASGTEGEWKAVQYIKSEFEAMGYETELQPFTFDEPIEGAAGSLQVDGQAFSETPHVFAGSANGDVTAEVVHVGLAYPEDIPAEVEGKIALIERGELPFVDKIQNVLDKGAVGVIMYNGTNSDGTARAGNHFGIADKGQDIPAIAITRESGLSLLEQVDGNGITVTIHVEGSGYEEKTSYNVIASKKPHPRKDTGQVVTIGSHHDSVKDGPGANDDASGVSAVLELARVMADVPTDTELRFMTFGAEENGLLGSFHYAYSLNEDEVKKIAAHFQMDMVGSKDAGDLIMFTPDGEKNLVTDLGAAAGARVSDVVPFGQLGRSDHVPFFYRGIPAALFIHAPLEPWYHTPDDVIDYISKEKLHEVAEIVGSAVYQIARTDTPALENARVAPRPVEYDYDDRPIGG